MILPQIILPWPPSKLSPNGSQRDFIGKAAAGKAYKTACSAILKEKGRAVRKLPAGSVVTRVVATYCPPPRVSRYDFDNMGRRMKQGFDAVAEAIGVDDGKWLELVQKRGERCKNGAVIIVVEVAA